MDSWHDYHLTGYSVKGSEHQITFNVSWPYESDTDIKRAVLTFSEVEGYFFEHDLGVSILYSITEDSLENFLTQNTGRFETEAKWGWPLFWRGDALETLGYLNGKAVKCFGISSSYGLTGWVLASKIDFNIV